jgi:hypothetical protein
MIGLSCDPRFSEEIDDQSGMKAFMEATEELADFLQVNPENIIHELTNLIQKQTNIELLKKNAAAPLKSSIF